MVSAISSLTQVFLFWCLFFFLPESVLLV
jgi:hypothetical protein